MTEQNGHASIDLGAILERTIPRAVRIDPSMIRTDALTAYELSRVGRVLDMGPDELIAEVNAAAKRGSWATIELAQAFAWQIVRRVEPALTWEEAQRFALEVTPGEPVGPSKRGGAKPSRSRGTSGPSTCTRSQGSGPRRAG